MQPYLPGHVDPAVPPTPALRRDRCGVPAVMERTLNGFVIKTAVVAAALLAGAELVSAQSGPNRGTTADQRACNADARVHCREVLNQGDMAVLACLRQHRGKLRRACEAVLQKHGQ
jgi:hypothetical protein